MTESFPLNWELATFFPQGQRDKLAVKLKELKQRFETVRDQLVARGTQPLTPKEWEYYLMEVETVVREMEDMNSLIGCLCAEDSSNGQYRMLEGEIAGIYPLREELISILEKQAGALNELSFQQLVTSSQVIATREKFLVKCREGAAYRLEAQCEVIANQLDVHGVRAWERLYDYLSSILRIPVMEKGEIVEKSPGQITFDHPDRSMRMNANYATQKAWKTQADPCALAINQISGSRLTRYKHLKVQDHLDVPLFRNRMQRQTLDAMWSAISARKGMLVTYLQTKARLLGLEKLSWFDLQAPLPLTANKQEKIPYPQACREIIKCFTNFSPEFGEFAAMSFQEKWVEAENRGGKRQGAFCTTLPGYQVSRIFMTYTETRDSQSTLAHELGHAYHSYVMRDMPSLLQDYPMNLAETASTFAETVTNEYIYQQAQTPTDRLLILDRMLQDSVSYLMNIHSRFLFEDEFHRRRQLGELSVEELSQLMVESQAQAYDHALDHEGYNPTFWISKLHFYISGIPFYNFPYTFGYLLSQGMYRIGQEDKARFPAQLREFLRKTGSDTAEVCVRDSFGKDLTQTDFWDFVIDIIEQRVQDYVAMANQVVPV
jgi:pepF/M3 family oligoendopeptidase